MPKGELFIKTSVTGWKDAWEEWRLCLEDGAIATLLAPAPMKKPVSNSNSQKEGVAYLGSTVGKYDERTISLDMHIVAGGKEEFLRRYNGFCSEVLSAGFFAMKTRYSAYEYNVIYQDCQPFEMKNFRMAKFTLSLIEPHPEIRTAVTI